ncbi:MAG: DUF484 family protein [Porticoccaceae bacterium]|jgi:uncharacterized protein YigA (DUF484 family)|nr:DUF484 family protein [Porticoccaceae bacterium]MEA3299585.1 DUF484 family protein [Pseudomonadota bacterium]HLS97149.1 DUF484 family protein [Porticoccaceae bacterium]
MSDRYKDPEQRREEEQVKDFLLEHPDFFSRHPDILESLALPHDSGKAVSLVERQVAVLRQRNVDLRHRLNELIDNARANDRLFDKSKRLVLNLLDADDLKTLVAALHDSLREDFAIPHVGLLALGEGGEAVPGLRRVGEDEAHQHLDPLFHSQRPICGVLRAEEMRYLFPEAAGIGSVAAVRLGRERTLAILALGNPDPHHYQSTSGTLFLGHIADVLNRVLPRFL